MSDYRFQIVEHNDIPCLHVIFDEQVIDADGFEKIIQTYIPLDDIQEAMEQYTKQMIDEAVEATGAQYEVEP